MTVEQVHDMFISWGYAFPAEYHYAFNAYLREMLRRNRVMVVQNDIGDIEALITYFITDDATKFYKKGPWDTPEENLGGKHVYFDKMVAKDFGHFKIGIRHRFREFMEDYFKDQEELHYHRAPFDKHVTMKRRRIFQNGIQSTSPVEQGV